MNRQKNTTDKERDMPIIFLTASLVCYSALVAALLSVTHKAGAAVPVPLITQYEFYLSAVCRHPSCCPQYVNYPVCKISGGINIDNEVSCSSLLVAYNEYNQCDYNAWGYVGVYPHIFDGTISNGSSCELVKYNPDGTTHNLLAISNIESFCLSSEYEPNGAECILNDVNSYKNNNICPPNGSNPIHTALGYKLQKETDYSATSVNTLKFERYYTSGNHWEQSGLGDNWRHTYAKRIQLYSNGVISTATAYRPNGDRFYFTLQGDDAWLGDQDVTARLIRLHDADNQLTGWEYTDSNNLLKGSEPFNTVNLFSQCKKKNKKEKQDTQHSLTRA